MVLTDEQRSIIADVDRPRWEGEDGYNIGEDSPTIRAVPGGVVIYRTLRAKADDGAGLVYLPAEGVIRRLPSEGAALGDDFASDVRIPRQGWSFPDVPADPDLSGLRSRTLVLNPTEQCNIRCTYCYYGGAYDGTRLHQTLSPSPEDLEKAIRGFLVDEDRVESSQQSIYFFGGEPLLGFKEMVRAVDLINRRRQELGREFPNLILQVNTNGMLLSREIVEFLIANDIYMNVSIDGPNHDLYRVDRRGKGTHNRVRAKIEWLAEEWPDYFTRRVALICVLSQPLDTKAMYGYFASWPTAHRALAWDFDLVLPGGSGSYDEFQQLFAEQRKIWNLFVQAHGAPQASRDRSLRYHYAFSHGFLHRSFHRALNQPQPESPERIGHLLGVQLVPGSEYLVLGADGSYYTSYEYQSEDFKTGTAGVGVDYGHGLRQLQAFSDGVRNSSCQTCWAARMCTVSLPEAPFNPNDDLETTRKKAAAKVARCRSERENLLSALDAIATIRSSYGEAPLNEHREDWQQQQVQGPSIEGFNA